MRVIKEVMQMKNLIVKKTVILIVKMIVEMKVVMKNPLKKPYQL